MARSVTHGTSTGEGRSTPNSGTEGQPTEGKPSNHHGSAGSSYQGPSTGHDGSHKATRHNRKRGTNPQGGSLSNRGNRGNLGTVGHYSQGGSDDHDARGARGPKLRNLRPSHEPTRSRTPGPLPGGVCFEVRECEGESHAK